VRRAPLVVLAIGALAFLNAAAWALITPPFQGPDEETHAAYAEYLGETGRAPDSSSDRPFASTAERRALAGTHHYSIIVEPEETRPPWERSDERRYRRSLGAGVAHDDGGGRTGASDNTPVSYVAPALAARVSGGSFFDRLLAMRLACALLAAVAAAFVCATVRELLPRVPWAPPAAGLAVAFQPMFGFIGGAVNPEAAAAAAGAVVLYLTTRALRRGLTPWLAFGMGIALAAGTLAKLSVLALAPAVLLALVVLVRRRQAPRRALVALGATAGALFAVWAAVALLSERESLPGASGQATLAHPQAAAPDPVHWYDRLSYLWQVFLPPVGPMEDLYTGADHAPGWTFYVKRAWASFGWTTLNLPPRAYEAIAAGLLLGLVLVAVAAWRERAALRGRRAEVAVLALAFVSLAVATHLNFARAQPEPYVLEQGRYLFPVATVAAVAAIGACFAFGRRWAPVAGTVLVAGMMVFSGLCQLFVFTSYYT
jgi:4-amino-4-deoxy-L-arabinose transferase-like glycosyltransferase